MARAINKLSARKVATLAETGRHSDGGGLYLSISGNGAQMRRRWVFMFRWQGKQREMGLGSVNSVPLAKARELAAGCRLSLAEGRNPLDERREREEAEQRERDGRRTFAEVADELLAAKLPQWSNEKHKAQWKMTLAVYAAPLRPMPVAEIRTADVLAVLEPMWLEKPETASRLRGRIEAVLDAARARGLIPENQANPARWRGHLDHLLARPQKLKRGHHEALPYQDLPDFIARLRQRPAMSAKALEFAILTAARTDEALGARWEEIDMERAIWTVPANRMKNKRTHRVALSSRAMEILEELASVKVSEFVFPGQKSGRPLSEMAMTMVLRRMKVANATVHGFRSSFRDWTGETTSFPDSLAEAALSHVTGDATERAYRRGDALERRRELMEKWAGYCCRLDANLPEAKHNRTLDGEAA